MKNTKIFYFIFLILFLFHINIQAQISVSKTLKKVDEALIELNFHDAIENCELILKQEPDNIAANFKLGFAYQHSIHKEKSLPYLIKVYRKDPIYVGNLEDLMDANPQYVSSLDYFLAVGYHHNNMFREGIKFYEKSKRYFEAVKKDTKNKDLLALLNAKIKDTDKKIIECKYGEKAISEPVNAQIENVGSIINGKYSDYAPVISSDETMLVFTSRREGTTGEKKDKDGEYFEDIYICRKNDLGDWTAPKNIGTPINTKFHDATIAIAPDGKQLFIYKDNSRGMGDIYYSELKGNNTWTEPKSMGENINSEFHETSISMSSDKKTVYFSSNRTGGYGGLDIYTSKLGIDGKWEKAVNLGLSINTEYDDDAPFISFDGKHLYFGSEGHSSMGGFDTFRATWNGNKWEMPENLGFPINTADNDIYFVLTADERTAYYASAKEGGKGEKDIYQIRMPKTNFNILAREDKLNIDIPKVIFSSAKIENAPNRPKLLLKGIIRDIQTKQVLESNIELILFETNNNLQNFTSNKEGKFSSTKVMWNNRYIIAVQKDGYLFHSESFNIPTETDENKEIELLIELVPLKVGAKINLTLFFDFDKANIRKESNSELKRLQLFMKKYPQVKIEIAGHTDNIGTDQRNRILSQQRAKAVVNYLQDNGIDEYRMIYNGYGASKPIANNKKANGNDDPTGRQKNRRTECIVTAVK